MIAIIPLLFNLAFAQTDFKCEANYDSLGIPHQEVLSEDHYHYCFGYHHGKDRAWEMDFFRRVAHGRNSEVLGFSQLKSDLMMRLLNLPSLAEKIWSEMPEDKKKHFEIYAKGVNAGFAQGKEAFEFKDAGFEPEAWNGVDSIKVILVQSFDQTRKTFFLDYQEQQNIDLWGKEKAEKLFDDEGMPWENNILKEGEFPVKESVKTTANPVKHLPKLWGEFPTVFGQDSGSNNWVVSGKKSKTGKAILANDPHLDLKTPMFWYWIHLKSPAKEVIGASLPGVPLVASGTNGKVAWGLTNSYYNSADAVFMKDDVETETIRPLVWVKFLFFKIPFFFKSFEKLKSGHPILPLELKSKHKVALRWTGFDLMASDVSPMLDLASAKNVEEMNENLKKVGMPSWNFVFADTKGDIGYRLVGKVFKSEVKTPYGMATESLEEFNKVEVLPVDDRPAVLRPKRNYIYSANNRHLPAHAKFYGGRGYSYSFRGNRIDELLQGDQDIESFKAIQCDRLAVDAKYFIPKIQKFIKVKELENWDLMASDTSSQLSLYRRLMDIMMEEWKLNEYALIKFLEPEYMDDQKVKELEKFYQRALQDVNGRGWAEFHRLGFPHLSNHEKWVFSPEMPGIGDNHTVDPGTATWDKSLKIYKQLSGASMRMIVEMTERPKILLTLPGINRNYTIRNGSDPWKEWKECKYSPIEF